jgi:hypothetical protein
MAEGIYTGADWHPEDHLGRADEVSLVKINLTLDPDLVRCGDGQPERLALIRLRDEFILSSLGYSLMELIREREPDA